MPAASVPIRLIRLRQNACVVFQEALERGDKPVVVAFRVRKRKAHEPAGGCVEATQIKLEVKESARIRRRRCVV